MAVVALKKELKAYADAIDKYNRQVRNYKTSVSEYNKKVEAYNENKGAPMPDEFTTPQPTRPEGAPSATTTQVKKLNQPSLTDMERRGGLINSVFNF
jgi:hypothetical protein